MKSSLKYLTFKRKSLCCVQKHHWNFPHSCTFLTVLLFGMIQASVIVPSFIFHGQKDGRWCLSSHIPVAVPQSKATRVPQAVSLFISQNLKEHSRRKKPCVSRFRIPPLVALETLLLGPKVRDQLRALRQAWPQTLFYIWHPVQSASFSSITSGKCGWCSWCTLMLVLWATVNTYSDVQNSMYYTLCIH